MRSLIRQLEQIRNTVTYDDTIVDVNLATIAEPTVSGSLEQDLNVLRTLIKDVKGSTNWYDGLGTYFDPSDTDAGSTQNKSLSLDNIRNNTLDAKTVILPVVDDNGGAGFTVSGTSTGFLLDTTTTYATASDRRGLAVFASTANSGSYWDEGGLDRVVRVDVINLATGNEMATSSGVVYAKLHDAADFGGTGTGTDVYVKFYADDAPIDLSDVQGGAPSSVKIVYPYRRLMSEMSEYDWARTEFVSSWAGDVELVEDIHNIWAFTGATDNDGSAQPWNNTTGNYSLSADPVSLKEAIDALNDTIGDLTYTNSYYLTSGSSVDAALDTIDSKLYELDNSLSSSSGEKWVETLGADVDKNVEHTLPYSLTYTSVSLHPSTALD